MGHVILRRRMWCFGPMARPRMLLRCRRGSCRAMRVVGRRGIDVDMVRMVKIEGKRRYGGCVRMLGSYVSGRRLSVRQVNGGNDDYAA